MAMIEVNYVWVSEHFGVEKNTTELSEVFVFLSGNFYKIIQVLITTTELDTPDIYFLAENVVTGEKVAIWQKNLGRLFNEKEYKKIKQAIDLLQTFDIYIHA